MILVLGHGISGDGTHNFLNKFNIEHDYLDTGETTKTDYELVIKSPGISYSNDYVKKLIANKARIITDIELVSMILNREFIGITGTNGKTTVTTLIYEGLKPFYDCFCCGNIGYSIGQAALEAKKSSLFVVELSSFQLKGVKNFKPQVALILNLENAHMDYHESFDDYVKSKMNITKNQKKSDYLIYNLDDKVIKNKLVTNASIRTFSLNNNEATCYLHDDIIYYYRKKQFSIKKFTKTNKANYLAAFIALKIYGIKNGRIKKTFKNFMGVPFRLEKIKNDIYNDAKSTNPSATINALQELDREVVLICGGYNRGESLDELIPFLGSIKKVYAYGMTQNVIYKFMKKYKIECYKEEKLQDFFPKVLEDNVGLTILYSPMFALFDQYKSFEERGSEFTRLVLRK